MIVTVGDAIVDLFGHPRGAAVDAAEHFVPHQGGALANVAVVCARLGAPARFVGAVGRDGHGERLVRALAEAGVDTACVARVPERTAVTFVRVADDGARSFLFYRTQTADRALSPELLASLPARPLAGASWLVTGTSALAAEPSASAVRSLVEEARAEAVPRAVDLNVRAHLWADHAAMREAVRETAQGAAIVKASEEDLDALGLPPTVDALGGFAPGAVPVLTLAERGAVARVGDSVLEAGAAAVPACDVVDATGAGDAFLAGVLSTLAARGGRWERQRDDADLWREALDAGCALGAMAVRATGATAGALPPWPSAVARALAGAAPASQK